MKNMSRFTVLSVLLIAALALGGALATAQDERVIVIGVEQEPPNLWPLNNLTFGGVVESFYGLDLWEWSVDREIYPVMAAEIPEAVLTDEGDTAVTITLREGLQWSDGTAITSADCELWHRVRTTPELATKYGRGSYPEDVKSFEVVDDLTFTVTYNGVFPDYLAAISQPECKYPGHIFQAILDAEGSLDEATYFTGGGFEGVESGITVGYGPYVVTEWNIGEGMTLVKNEFWQGNEPAFDRVILRFITDDVQKRNAMRNGEIDISFNWSDDTQPEYAAMENVETFSVLGVYSDALWIRSGENGVSAEHGGEALMDERVRRAIAHAINRVFFAEQLVGPGIPAPTSWYPSVLWPEDLPFLEYNVAGARALLDEAGWVDTDGDEPAVEDVESGMADCSGVTPRENDGVALANLRFVTTENTLRNNYQLVIGEALSCVGIGVDIQIIPATTLFASFADRGTLTTYEWDLALFANSADPLTPTSDADSYYCSGIPSDENPDGFNPWQFCNPRYDEVDQQIRSTLPGPERDELIAEAVRLKFEGHFWHGLRLRNTWFAVNSAVVDPESVRNNVGTLAANWFTGIENWVPAE